MVSTPYGEVSTWGNHFFVERYCSRRGKEDVLTLQWEIILPRCGGISVLSRGTALVACWIHQPQPISNHSAGFRFPHLGAGIDPRDLRLPPRLIRVVAIWTVFVTWGWELVLLVYGGTSGSAKGPSFAACWHLEPISHKPGELGFLHPAGTYPPGETAF